MTDAAIAVLNAYNDFPRTGFALSEHKALAAAIKTAADQVVPLQSEPTEETIGPSIDFGYAWALFSQANDIRQELLAIATELEGGND